MTGFKKCSIVIVIGFLACGIQSAGGGDLPTAKMVPFNSPLLSWDFDYQLLNQPIPKELKNIFVALPYHEGVRYLISISTSCPACGNLASEAIKWKQAKLTSILKNVVLLNLDEGEESSTEREIQSFLPSEAVYLKDPKHKLCEALFIEGTPELIVIDKGVIVGLIRGSDQITAFFNAIYR